MAFPLHIQTVFDVFPILYTFKIPVEDKVTIVSNNWALNLKKKMLKSNSFKVVIGCKTNYSFWTTRHPQIWFSSQQFLNFLVDNTISTWNDFNRNALAPLLSQISGCLPINSNMKELRRDLINKKWKAFTCNLQWLWILLHNWLKFSPVS